MLFRTPCDPARKTSRRSGFCTATLTLLAAGLAAAPTVAQDWQSEDVRCRGGSERGKACQKRWVTLPAVGELEIDGNRNGGLKVVGSSRADVELVAKVSAWKGTDPADIEIRVQNGSVTATGPGKNWAVGFEAQVPSGYDLNLEAFNGGIEVAGVEGRLRLATKNGGIALRDVGGDVIGETLNGGLSVKLDGHSWRGEGLELETTNGGIDLLVPEGYSAELDTETTNGPIEIAFPVEVSGKINKHIRATLGSGGAPIRLETTNGGVRVRNR